MARDNTNKDVVLVDDIDGSFVPRPVNDIASVELDGEVVLGVRSGDGLQTFCLNRTGGIVWSCFDGEATLDDLIDDLSEAFEVGREVVAEDVINLARHLGVIGLLAGVRPPYLQSEQSAGGLEIGNEVPPAELTDLDGRPVSLEAFRGRRVLLVNWSPFCGFCDRIGPDFGSVQEGLRAAGVELVLLALGEAEPNRELLARHDLDCIVLLQQGNVDVFYGVGTPAAYLVDEDGRIAAPLAVGAENVPALARDVAGPE